MITFVIFPYLSKFSVESSERTETLERKPFKDRSPSPSKIEDHDEFGKDETKNAERKTSYTEIRLSKRTEDGKYFFLIILCTYLVKFLSL